MSFCGGFRLFDAVVGGVGSVPSDHGNEILVNWNFRNFPLN